MGFLKDLHALTKQGNAAYARLDVGARLDAASRSMDEASRVLAVTTARADEEWLEAARLHATATIVEARQLPMVLGMNLVVDVDLVVTMASGLPLPVSITEQVAPLQLARLAPGGTVDVSIVPGRPESVRIEWGG